MKEILLLRHAKSSWDEPGLRDYDRPLADRGRRDASMMGRVVKKAGYLPGAVVASPARRARETLELFSEAAGLNEKTFSWEEDLYYGNWRDYLKAVRIFSGDTDRILLVGHNPNMEEAAGLLCGEAAIRMPTAALACFECGFDRWDLLDAGRAELKWMIIPKVISKIL